MLTSFDYILSEKSGQFGGKICSSFQRGLRFGIWETFQGTERGYVRAQKSENFQGRMSCLQV